MDVRRDLPSVELVQRSLDRGAPHGLRVRAARDAVAAARVRATGGHAVDRDAVIADAERRLDRVTRSFLAPVVNATGVLLHTNLGRAPLGPDALDAVVDAAAYSNLEYDMTSGAARFARHDHAGNLFATACGAEAGVVVNNNASAVLLVLAALARDREVVVSRGELVEIGGSFRVPDVMREAGVRLVEVGTTNRTRLRDYTDAITDRTAAVLKVHASNYRMIGFVEETTVAELTTLGPPVLVDAGAGLLDETTPWLPHRPAWLRDELGVHQCIGAGAALVTFSGDKLLGGPQAGVIVGRAALVNELVHHPLARVVRADKLTLAAMQSVALTYLSGDATALPLWRMALATVEELQARADDVAVRVPRAKVVDTHAVAGGGSLPGSDLPSVGIAVDVANVDGALADLRGSRVVALGRDGSVVCDLRTVDPRDDDRLAEALGALSPSG